MKRVHSLCTALALLSFGPAYAAERSVTDIFKHVLACADGVYEGVPMITVGKGDGSFDLIALDRRTDKEHPAVSLVMRLHRVADTPGEGAGGFDKEFQCSIWLRDNNLDGVVDLFSTHCDNMSDAGTMIYHTFIASDNVQGAFAEYLAGLPKVLPGKSNCTAGS